MNQITIKYQQFENNYTITIDGKAISPYSEMNNYFNKPLLEWANSFWDVVDAELNDTFEVTVISDEFEKNFMADMKWKFPVCTKYHTADYTINHTFEERLARLKAIAQKHGVAMPPVLERVKLYSDTAIAASSEFIEQVSLQEAFIAVVSDASKIVAAEKGVPKVYILSAMENKVTCIGNETYVWEMQAERIPQIMEYAVAKYAGYKWLISLVELLKQVTLSGEEQETLLVEGSTEPVVLIEDIPSVEVGTQQQIQMKVFPSGMSMIDYRTESSNSNVADVSGNIVQAIGVGTATISFYKNGSIYPFAQKTIEVFRDASVQKIELALEHTRMKVGDSQFLKVTCIPHDADDIAELEISTDATDVISLGEDGKIIGIHGGKATIFAKTKKASAQITIEIAHNLEQIILPEEEIKLSVGERKEIQVQLVPENCINGAYVWSSSNERVATIIRDEFNNEVIRAVGIGNCELTCQAKDGSCEAHCRVLVSSRLYTRPGEERTYNANTAGTHANATQDMAGKTIHTQRGSVMNGTLAFTKFHMVAVALLLLDMILLLTSINWIGFIAIPAYIGAGVCTYLGYNQSRETKTVSILLAITIVLMLF